MTDEDIADRRGEKSEQYHDPRGPSVPQHAADDDERAIAWRSWFLKPRGIVPIVSVDQHCRCRFPHQRRTVDPRFEAKSRPLEDDMSRYTRNAIRRFPLRALVALAICVAAGFAVHLRAADGSKGKLLVYDAKVAAEQGDWYFKVELEPILFRLVPSRTSTKSSV